MRKERWGRKVDRMLLTLVAVGVTADGARTMAAQAEEEREVQTAKQGGGGEGRGGKGEGGLSWCYEGTVGVRCF